MKKILILCTGNSCRSQMAEGFLKTFDSSLEVNSAGTNPSDRVHPKYLNNNNSTVKTHKILNYFYIIIKDGEKYHVTECKP